MNTKSTWTIFAVVSLLAAGCAEEHHPAYAPVYQPAPVYQAPPPAPQTVYVYPQQSNYQPQQPLVTQVPQGADPSAQGAQQAPQYQAVPQVQGAPQPPPQQVIVSQAPPAPQVEVVPVAPGPEYVWTPGYWSWNGGWIWVGGAWALRPHPYAVWVGPRWVHRGHGYYYERGHWR